MPDGHVIKKPEDLSQSRWKPVNELKNSPVTLQLHMSGTRLYPCYSSGTVVRGSEMSVIPILLQKMNGAWCGRDLYRSGYSSGPFSTHNEMSLL